MRQACHFIFLPHWNLCWRRKSIFRTWQKSSEADKAEGTRQSSSYPFLHNSDVKCILT